MSFNLSLEYDYQAAVVNIQAQGSASTADIQNMYQQARQLADRHDCKKLLVDVHKLSMDYSSGEVLKLMQDVDKLLPGFMVARVVDFSDYKNDFIEVASHKVSSEIKNFRTTEDARRWLQQTEQP